MTNDSHEADASVGQRTAVHHWFGVTWDAQRIARVSGVLFLITFITAIPAIFLYGPVLENSDYIVSAGADLRVSFGAVLELLLIIANIGTAVVLFPVLKREDEILALGYITARIVECMFIAIGILSLLTVVALRQGAGGTDTDILVTIGEALVAIHDWTFLLGPGFVVGIGNGLLLGSLMYRSRLVPRRMAILGVVGGPLVSFSGIAVLLGFIEPQSVWQVIATIPEFVWELTLGFWLIIEGFNPSAEILSAPGNQR